MATQAAHPRAAGASPQRPPLAQGRILRIGIVQGGRIVEERLVRKRESISVGQSTRSTFVVPTDALPRQWLLFEMRGGRYVARFSEGMDARIAVANEIVTLSQLKQAGRVRRVGPAWLMPLDERSRGKITVGDLTILFQFVTPPPQQPRPQLPASVRGHMWTNFDWMFVAIAGGSFLLHLIVVLYLRSVDWPRKPDIEAIPDRFVQMVIKKEEPKKEEVKKEEVKKEEKKPEVKLAPKRELTESEKQKLAEEKAKRDEARREKLKEQVAQMGVLKLLGVKGENGNIADVLGKGDVDRDQEAAFKGIGGVGVATDATLKGLKTGGSGGGKVASVGGLRGGGAIQGGGTGSGAAERSVRAVMKTEAPSVDGELDGNVVAKEVKARAGAVKACYEKALKRNPNLSGKITIGWTITQAGTVTGVNVENDSVGDPEVASCIKGQVSRWRFPAPSGGTVDVAYPFVFSAAQ